MSFPTNFSSKPLPLNPLSSKTHPLSDTCFLLFNQLFKLSKKYGESSSLLKDADYSDTLLGQCNREHVLELHVKMSKLFEKIHQHGCDYEHLEKRQRQMDPNNVKLYADGLKAFEENRKEFDDKLHI